MKNVDKDPDETQLKATEEYLDRGRRIPAGRRKEAASGVNSISSNCDGFPHLIFSCLLCSFSLFLFLSLSLSLSLSILIQLHQQS